MKTDHGTGWERHRRIHFDEIVENYDRVRPNYPDRLLQDIFAYTIPSSGKKALEIGPGTGKATAPFLKAGYDVTAVEIGANMADFLLERFNDYPNFRVTVSTFEDAPLEENRYDLIYAASAFHWVDAEIGCPKVFRLLKGGGVFALLRYNFNYIPPKGEALSEEIQAAYERHFFSFYAPVDSHGVLKITKESFKKNPKLSTGYGFEDMAAYGFRDVSMHVYEGTQTYDADSWIAMLDTLSNHRNLPDANREALYAEVKEAIEKNGGQFNVDYIFQLYMGRKP